jgi:transcriptional regulator of acetoin/glycerol metabolism
MELFHPLRTADEFLHNTCVPLPLLAKLHAACAQYGLKKDCKRIRFRLRGDIFERLVGKHSELIEAFNSHLDIMDGLYIPHLIYLTDINGVILQMSGPEETVLAANRTMNIGSGSSMSLSSVGINGVSAAVALGRTAFVSGKEHYLELLRDWSSIATPVHDPVGRTVAYVSMTASSSISVLLMSPFTEWIAAQMEEALKKAKEARPPIADGQLWEKLLDYELSTREREIALLWIRDYDYKQIGKRLSISENTVRAYISRINSKMKVKSKASLILKVFGEA